MPLKNFVRWAVVPLVATSITIASLAQQATAPTLPLELRLNRNERDIVVAVSGIVENYNFQKAHLDDEMSARIFDNFFWTLDSGRKLFLASDIAEFSTKRTQLDDMYKRGDLSFANQVFNRYLQRVAERSAHVQKLLSQELDLENQESLRIDREEAPWCTDLAELDEVWRQIIENDYLVLILAERKQAGPVDPAAQRAELARRLQLRFKNLLDLDRDMVFEMAVNVMTRSFDPHTDYFGPVTVEDFRMSMRLSLSGIGATLSSRNGYVRIMELSPGGPAAESGQLRVGDLIMDITAEGEEKVNLVDMSLHKAVRHIRGVKGTKITLGILRGGINGKRSEVSLIRDTIKMTDAEAKSRIVEIPGADPATPELAGVIRLPSFYASSPDPEKNLPGTSCTDDFVRELKKLKQAGIKTLVVDLRNNGGGSLVESIRLTGLFIDRGPVVQVRDADGRIDVRADNAAGMLWDGPLVVMVNEHSASASEIFAAAIQDYQRGVVVGTSKRTHGKGSVQQVYPLSEIPFFKDRGANFEPGEIKFTMAKFYRINGGSTQQRGVTPDIELPHFITPDDEGEVSLRYHLTYDEIPKAEYKPLQTIAPLLPKLNELSLKRLAADTDFAELNKEIQRAKGIMERKDLSLCLKDRETMAKDDILWRKERQEILWRLAGRDVAKARAEQQQQEELEDDESLSLGLAELSPSERGDILLDIYLKEAVRIGMDLAHHQP